MTNIITYDCTPKKPNQRPKGSRAQAINAMCKSCIYDARSAGNWRQQVTACPSQTCPLYPFRPLTGTRTKPHDGARGESA